MRYLRLIAAAAVLLLGLAACGGEGGSDGGPTGAAGPAQDRASEMEEAELAFYDCMRDHGVDLPDPDPNQEGVQLMLPEGQAGDPAVQEAMDECRDLLPGGGEPGAKSDPEQIEAMRDFTKCLRAEGIDIPDPAADGSLTMPEGVTRDSAEFQTAVDECRQLIEGQGLMIKGGGGGGQ